MGIIAVMWTLPFSLQRIKAIPASGGHFHLPLESGQDQKDCANQCFDCFSGLLIFVLALSFSPQPMRKQVREADEFFPLRGCVRKAVIDPTVNDQIPT